MSAISIISVVLCVSQLFGLPMTLGILWYYAELPEVSKTLVTRLDANKFATIGLMNIVFSNSVIAIHFAGGGLGDTVCEAIHALMCSLVLLFAFNINLILLVRYLYICVFRNVGVVNEDLVYSFLTMLQIFLSFFFNLLKWSGGLQRGPSWYYCAGTTLSQENFPGAAVCLVDIVAMCVLTPLWYFTLYLKIYNHERLAEASTPQTPNVYVTSAKVRQCQSSVSLNSS